MNEPFVVPVRKFACGNLECEFFGLVKDPDIWPATCCDGFIFPHIPCRLCDKTMETAVERFEDPPYGWMPGIDQEGLDPRGGPFASQEAAETAARAFEDLNNSEGSQ